MLYFQYEFRNFKTDKKCMLFAPASAFVHIEMVKYSDRVVERKYGHDGGGYVMKSRGEVFMNDKERYNHSIRDVDTTGFTVYTVLHTEHYPENKQLRIRDIFPQLGYNGFWTLGEIDLNWVDPELRSTLVTSFWKTTR